MTSDAGQVNWVDTICELRTEELNAVFCNNTQRVVSKHHHSLKCRKLRLLQQGPSFQTYMLFQYVFIFKGQFVSVRAVARTEKEGYTMWRVFSLSVSEVDRQSPCFKSQKV